MRLFFENDFNQQAICNFISEYKDNPLNIIDEVKKFNLFHAAAYYGLDDVFLAMVELTKGDGLNLPDKKGRTAIHHLASNGNNNILSHLFQYYAEKINLNQVNKKGRTPLHIAAKHLHLNTVSLLVDSGANLEILDIFGHSPLSLTYYRHYPGLGIQYNNPIVSDFVNKILYWNRATEELNRLTFNEDQDILRAWFLGMNHLNDFHLLPGANFSLRGEEYTVNNVYKNDLAKYVVLENLVEKILLCLSQITSIKKIFHLKQHANPNHMHFLINTISPKILEENGQLSQIWGVGLAGIDAQVLASQPNGDKSKQKLILIDSPGLPANANLNNTQSPKFRHYIFKPNDELHTKGTYGWQHGAITYEYDFKTKANNLKQNSLKSELQRLKQKKSAYPITSITRTNYIPGEQYNLAGEYQSENNDEIIEQLYRIKNHHLQNVNLHLIDFVKYEYCAHGLAYLHLPDNNLIKWWNDNELSQNGASPEFPIKRIIHEKGLYCYLLKCNQEWVLMFQGTDPFDKSSIKRDLDRSSAGIKRIRQQYIDIIQSIECELRATRDNIKFIICGHSLGGADAQNFFTAFLAYLSSFSDRNTINNQHWMKFRARNKQTIDNTLQNIKEIHLYAYNGAGIRGSTAKLAKASADKMRDIIITVNHQQVNQDIVNIVGETMLYDFDTNHVRVRSLFFNGRENFIDRITYAHIEQQFGDNAAIGKHDLKEGHDAQQVLQGLKCEPKDALWDQVKHLIQR